MTDLSYEAIWAAIPLPAFLIADDGKILSANVAAENFADMSCNRMQAGMLADFVGADSVVVDMLAQAGQGAASIVQHKIDISWNERFKGCCTAHAGRVQEESGEVLLLISPRGVAERVDRSLSHRSAARSVTGMAAMLAHEIRTPLAGISGAAQLIAMNGSEEDNELSDLIVQETSRIGSLVDRVEQFGDQRPISLGPVNIHDVVDRTKRAALVGYAMHVRFIEQYDPSLPAVVGDADQLVQVVQNLIKNAAEAVPKVGGVITIRTKFKAGVKMALPGQRSESLPLELTIADNGPGVPPNLVHDIFEPFVSTKTNGSGLGLALVSKIVADHGGVIQCNSVPGRTEFQLLLPVWKDGRGTASGGAA